MVREQRESCGGDPNVTCDVCGAVLGDPMTHLQWHISPAAGTTQAPPQDAVGMSTDQR